MKPSPAFQFYPNDWLSSPRIMLMSPAEEGAYIRLLAIAWNSEDCSLPNDDAQLAILSRLGEEWHKGGVRVVKPCFVEKDGRLYNERLLKERKKQEDWRKKSSAGGKKGAKSRWGNRKMRNRGGQQMVTKCLQPEDDSSSSFSSNKDTVPPKKAGKSNVKDFITLYQEAFTEKFQEKPNIRYDKDAAIAKRLLGMYGLEKLQKYLKDFFDSEDDFIKRSGYTIGVFSVSINKFISKRRTPDDRIPFFGPEKTSATPYGKGNGAGEPAAEEPNALI